MPVVRKLFPPLLALAFVWGPACASAQTHSVFGTEDASEAALVGTLYDLKQTQQHQPTAMDLKTYGKVVEEFLVKNWDESVLNRYYRVTHPLYTTQIFIPVMPASGGPKAFRMERRIKPSLWVIHYKGQVSAPSDGAWRFWGYGGEVCCAAINGKTVLVGNHADVKTPAIRWKSAEPPGRPAGSGKLVAGDWIELKAGQIVDLDILIGERGGGTFDCFLLVEKRGEIYAAEGAPPVFPIFQLAPYDTPVPAKAKDAPPFARNGPVWKAFQ